MATSTIDPASRRAPYADPTRCPDCRTLLPDLPPERLACAACGLRLSGEAAQALFVTLQEADALLETLRQAPAVPPRRPAATELPAAPPAAPGPERRGLGAVTVPKILLGLGALCLLVAAVTFLVVAWSWLGVGGRTAVLVAITVVTGALGGWLWRRDIRFGAEALLTVSLGLLALDVVGAGDAGWLGDLGFWGTMSAVGIALVAAGTGLTLWLRDAQRSPVAPQLVAAIGLVLAPAGLAEATDGAPLGFAVGSAGIAAYAVGMRAAGFRLLPFLAGLAGGLWWLMLLGSGLAEASDRPTVSSLVLDSEALPLVFAAALMLVPAYLLRSRPTLASLPLAVAGTVLSVTVALPATDGQPTALVTVALALLVLWSAVFLRLPSAWLPAAGVPGAPLAVLVLLAAGGGLVQQLLDAASRLTPGAETWDVALPSSRGELAAWLAIPVGLGLAVALVAASRLWSPPVTFAREHLVPLLALPAGGLALTLALTPVPLVLAVTVLVVVAALLTRVVLRGAASPAYSSWVLALVALSTAVWLGCYSLWLGALALAAATTLLYVLAERGRRPLILTVSSALLPPALAGLVWCVGGLLGLAVEWRALPVLLAIGTLAILRRSWPLESGAVLAGLVASTAAVSAAADESVSLALHLTVAGGLVALSAVVHRDRRLLAWPGGLLLAAATWVRLADLGVEQPEAYTLPSALALTAAGLWRLRRDPTASTALALGPGLTLATVPSLLWVLFDDPFGLRTVLLGLGCLLLVLVGARLRWSAPLVVGAVVGAAVVLRLLEPYAAALPPWVLIAAAGTVLLTVGVTWEARVRNLRDTAGYLARLR